MYNCVHHFVHALTPLPILSNCLPCTVHESDACQSQLIAEWAKAVGTDPNLPVLRSKAEVLVVLTNSSECMFAWKKDVLIFFVFLLVHLPYLCRRFFVFLLMYFRRFRTQPCSGTCTRMDVTSCSSTRRTWSTVTTTRCLWCQFGCVHEFACFRMQFFLGVFALIL